MHNTEYLKRNALGFEGDNFIATKLEQLIKEFNIKTVVETGTYLGYTTKRFASMVDEVYTVEINPEYFNKAVQHVIALPNVFMRNNDSPSMLNETLPLIKDNTLLFLDAHWGNNCPLIDELNIIGKFKNKPVIAIHDFKVPGRADLGFDSYNGQDFTYEWVKPYLDAIYGGENNYTIEYNNEAEGAKRGIIYITPKVILEELIEPKKKAGRPKGSKNKEK